MLMTRLSKATTWLISLLVLILCPPLAAQSGGAQDPQSGAGRIATPPIQVIVTGCLKRGAESGSYYIGDLNGTIWKLTSSTVDLAGHVNHSVTITGKPVSNPQQKNNNEQAGTTDEVTKPQPMLRVLTVKMLSPSCTR
jgi:hypothetical protein